MRSTFKRWNILLQSCSCGAQLRTNWLEYLSNGQRTQTVIAVPEPTHGRIEIPPTTTSVCHEDVAFNIHPSRFLSEGSWTVEVGAGILMGSLSDSRELERLVRAFCFAGFSR